MMPAPYAMPCHTRVSLPLPDARPAPIMARLTGSRGSTHGVRLSAMPPRIASRSIIRNPLPANVNAEYLDSSPVRNPRNFSAGR